MSCNWMRRAVLALASASAFLLAACGSSTIESKLTPSRIVVFGDGFSSLGQGGSRYTVNDATLTMWTEVVAGGFGLTLANSSSGGASYATGNVRVNTKPDATGSSATPTVKEQVDAFLAAGSIGASDVLIVSAGTSDLIAEIVQLNAGAQTSDQMMADVRQAGRDLGAQVRRLVEAGAKQVVSTGSYDLGRTPWATATSQTSLISQASTAFNTALLVSIVDLGNQVLFIDTALLFNQMTGTPSAFGFVNATDPVCTSIDPGVGIGIGAGQLNSALCTPSTILPSANFNQYIFADRIYPTPMAQRRHGEYAFQRIRARW